MVGMRIVIFVLLAVALWAERRPLVVISVDGLDHRYLRDADKLGLKIPALRKLMGEGEFSGGLIGVECLNRLRDEILGWGEKEQRYGHQGGSHTYSLVCLRISDVDRGA